MNYDPYVTCVYDPVHQILRSRLITHYTKCSKNFPNSKKKHCPFDASHIVDRVDYQHHVDTCSAKEIVIHYMIKENDDDKQNFVEIEPHVVDEKGSWDNDVVESSYNPLNKIEERMVMRNISVQCKSEKKKFRNAERVRFQQLANKVENDVHENKDYSKTGAKPKFNRYSNDRRVRENYDSDDDCTNMKPLRPPKTLNKLLMNQLINTSSINNTIDNKIWNSTPVVKSEKIFNPSKQADNKIQLCSKNKPKDEINDDQTTSKPFSYAFMLNKNIEKSTNYKSNTSTKETNQNQIIKFPSDSDKLFEKLTQQVQNFIISDEEIQKKSEPLNERLNLLKNGSLENNSITESEINANIKKSSRCAAKFLQN